MSTIKNDQWSASAYQSSAAFVPRLSSKVLSLLDAQPGEQILDIGCGDGVLTSQLASMVGPSGSVLGLDSSPSFIDHDKKTYSSQTNLSFQLQDCSALHDSPSSTPQFLTTHTAQFDKIFSNAALHWILPHHQPSIRVATLKALHSLLKPGGIFAFELGGAGNVSEVHTALIYALIKRGISIEKARNASPWFFPSAIQFTNLLRETGFAVNEGDVELECRPTRMEDETATGGGIRGWVRLMGASFLDVLPEEQRDGAVEEVCDVLGSICSRWDQGAEGGEWLGYVRCRGIARKL